MIEFFMYVIIATIAALGFSYANHPPKYVLPWCPFFGGIGYSIRLLLINSQICNYVLATFISSMAVGLFSFLLAKRIKTPIEVIAFPALLPMIPGLQAYTSVLSIFKFINSTDEAQQIHYLDIFFNNIFVAIAAVFALAVGISLVLFIFYEKSFTMTRYKNFRLKYTKKLKSKKIEPAVKS